jgi:hypothetical protein
LDAQSRTGARKLGSYVKATSRVVSKAERYASLVIGAPLSTSFFATRKYVNIFFVGVPVREATYENGCKGLIHQHPSFFETGTVRLLHAPSSAQTKGTFRIRTAIETLVQEGFRVEFKELCSAPHSSVLRAIEEADLVIDQIYSDTPLSGFACEAASFGKPAIVGGYGLDTLAAHLPKGLDSVSIQCSPEALLETIRNAITQLDLPEIGQTARTFVSNRWSPEAVARNYWTLFHGVVPDKWWLIPDDVSYLYGAGQSRDWSRRQIRGLVAQRGKSSLGLDHKPKAREALILFSQETG